MEKKKYNFPEVKLGQYKGLAITRHVRPVTEKTLDIEMVHQTRMHAAPCWILRATWTARRFPTAGWKK